MKTRSTKRTTKRSQEGDEIVDQNAESLVVDENSDRVHVQDIKMDETVEEKHISLKNDRERVIAVIDKNPAEGGNVEDDNDDDIPEDISWKASKETAIRGLAREKESFLDSKRKEKQMRMERNERLREQKERKRAREFSRLPVEVLQHVAKQQDSHKREEVAAQTVATGDHVTFDSSSEDEKEETEEQEEEPAVKVVVLSRETKKPKKIQQSASLFLQEHLFGDRIQRISSTKHSDNRRKTKGFAPAMNFSKKS